MPSVYYYYYYPPLETHHMKSECQVHHKRSPMCEINTYQLQQADRIRMEKGERDKALWKYDRRIQSTLFDDYYYKATNTWCVLQGSESTAPDPTILALWVQFWVVLA